MGLNENCIVSIDSKCGSKWKLHHSSSLSLTGRTNKQRTNYLSIARHNQRPLSLIKECIIWNKDWGNLFLSQSLDVSTSFLFQKQTTKNQGSNKYSITHVKVDSLYLTWKASFSTFSRWTISGQLVCMWSSTTSIKFLPSIFDLTSNTGEVWIIRICHVLEERALVTIGMHTLVQLNPQRHTVQSKASLFQRLKELREVLLRWQYPVQL